MTGPPSCYTDRSQIRAKLDAALASSPRGPRPGSPARGPAAAPAPAAMVPTQQEQIYAPVAALQQKIQQQQQVRLAHGHAEPGSVPHPPGPQVCPQQQQYCQQQQSYQQQYGGGQKYCQQSHPYPTQKQQQSNGSPEGEQYGFGMQFQIHSKSFYSRQQGQQQQHPSQQQQLQQQQHHMQMQQQQQQFAYHHLHHDQIMSDMDPMLAQRPQPPDINGHVPASAAANGAAYWPAGGQYVGGGAHNGMGHCDAQSALRVRQWIETRTVSDVRKVRPILNQEIQRGLSLRKTAAVSDRSQPHF
jgi:hypothetical protein